jgi:hypothetical protein
MLVLAEEAEEGRAVVLKDASGHEARGEVVVLLRDPAGVTCALLSEPAVLRHRRRERWSRPGGPLVRIRMTVHVGEAGVSRMDGCIVRHRRKCLLPNWRHGFW